MRTQCDELRKKFNERAGKYNVNSFLIDLCYFYLSIEEIGCIEGNLLHVVLILWVLGSSDCQHKRCNTCDGSILIWAVVGNNSLPDGSDEIVSWDSGRSISSGGTCCASMMLL
jgi:hypothetical protein